MKNRYLKGAHISERKVREMLKLFCDDLTATQIAGITGISRITVNAYLKMIRTHIASQFEDRLPMTDRSLIEATSLDQLLDSDADSNSNEAVYKKPFYGIRAIDDRVHSAKIIASNQQEIFEWLKSAGTRNPEAADKTNIRSMQAVIDFNNLKLYRIDNGTPKVASLKGPVDDIELFWNMLKARLVKFRGLNGNTLDLHVKETAFRFNHRDKNIFELLVNVFHNRPLHAAKQLN
ncbi:MAG: hypothetical protein EOO02_25100 [Chitinophagaceae bacterium]|nr:MAG: hypothetical protein EOO02_25100 [Chitinophagaceae bacterium]